MLDHRGEIFHLLVGDRSFAAQHSCRFCTVVDLLLHVRRKQAREQIRPIGRSDRGRQGLSILNDDQGGTGAQDTRIRGKN